MSKRKTVLVTGGTSGIGFSLCQKLHQQGFNVYAVGRNETVLKQMKKEGIYTIQADIRNIKRMDEWVDSLPPIDVAILNAGVGKFLYAHETSDEQIDEMMEVNVLSLMKLTTRLQRNMMFEKKGHIIFVASQAGKIATPKASVYAATKHAVLGFANALRLEMEEHNIQVTTINPGPIDTPFLTIADEKNSYRNSLGKFILKPEQVADAIIKVIQSRKREVNMPIYMNEFSKWYMLFPTIVEKIAKPFMMKK